jgi:hypothetical protein
VFDGVISKQDMKVSLTKYVDMPASKIDEHRLDRLFRLLSFYKSDVLEPSDFDRLLQDVNPLLTATSGEIKQKFKSSKAGAFVKESTHSWTYNAI